MNPLPYGPWGEMQNPSLTPDGAYQYPAPPETQALDVEFSHLVATIESEPAAAPTTVKIPHQRTASSHRRRTVWARLGPQLRRVCPTSSLSWLRRLSVLIAAAIAAVAMMTTLLVAAVSYPPLVHLAATCAPPGLARLWPLLVFGPWLVSFLSILRAAIHRRRARQSWAVVLAFSALTVYLCIAAAPHTVTGTAIAGLPPTAALICFHQLVRQITLTAPLRQAAGRRHHKIHKS